MDEKGCISQDVLGVVECFLVFGLPFEWGVLLLAGEEIRERCTDARDMRYEGVVEVEHAEKSTEVVDGFWRRHLPEGTDLFGQRFNTVAVYPMAKEVDGVDPEDALCLFDD